MIIGNHHIQLKVGRHHSQRATDAKVHEEHCHQ